MLISLLCALRHLRPNDSVDVCGRCCVIEEFPFVGEVRLAVLTRFRERAICSYRTIDRLWANVGLSSSETMDAEMVGVVGNAQVTKENDVHGVRRQVVDSAYLLAAIEFESEANNRGSGRSSSSCRQRRRKRWGRRPWRRRHGLRMGHRARGQRRQERRPWVQRQRQARRQQ